ncbi:HNH/ENDO VII family nuclease [Yersinia alsatica]|uniref:HNH/ENDO VII family nuclease n=1 Tax=Yersinia alsatica TaxID=2890317 RepID=UPI002E272146
MENNALRALAAAEKENPGTIAKWQADTGSSLQQGIQAATAAIQGLAGGDMAKALAGASAPYLAEVIHNMTTDANGKVNTEANLMAHAVLGAVMAQVNGNSALAGASGAVMGEYIAQQMYLGINREDLTEEQRQTISALGTLAAGLAGGLAGNSTADAVAGAQAGKNAVENNSLHDIIDNKTSGVSQEQKYQNAQKELVAAVEEFKAQNCAGLSADACSAKISEHRDELLKGAVGFGIDFVPIIGDIKSFAEAQSALDYLIATVGLVPVLGDTAGKLIKAAETALKKGDVAEASKLLNKASDEVSSANYFGQERKYWSAEPIQFNGNKVYQRNDLFDLNAVDARGRSNIQRMEKGLAPLDANGNSVNLHHMLQRQDGPIAEVTQTFHKDNHGVIHINDNSIPSGINRTEFDKWRSNYWKERAQAFKG